jgi:hypothetical protein
MLVYNEHLLINMHGMNIKINGINVFVGEVLVARCERSQCLPRTCLSFSLLTVVMGVRFRYDRNNAYQRGLLEAPTTEATLGHHDDKGD